jgi:hypothetical protein
LTSIIAKASLVSDSNSAIYNISVGLYRSLESSHQIILEISRKMSPGVDFEDIRHPFELTARSLPLGAWWSGRFSIFDVCKNKKGSIMKCNHCFIFCYNCKPARRKLWKISDRSRNKNHESILVSRRS